MMSRIDSWHRTIYRSPFSKWPPQYRTDSILSDFNDISYVGVEIFQCWQSIRDIIIYPHIKFWWYRTMLNFCGIVVAILKMVTGRNCSMLEMMSRIESPTLKNFYRSPFSKWPPQYRKNSTLFDIINIWYVGR
jgi:hypothetical protein